MTRHSRPLHRRRREAGQSLVEFALSVMVLLILLLGTMNLTYGVYCYHTISSAARDAVRFAIVRGPNSASPATLEQIQQAAIRAAVGVSLTPDDVTASWPANPRLPGKRDAKVTIAHPYQLLLMPITLTLTSTSQMLASQ